MSDTVEESIEKQGATMEKRASAWHKVDKKVLGFSGAIAILFVCWVAIDPTGASNVFSIVLSFLTTGFGWLYLIVVTVFVVFLIWLGASKYGNIKLGRDDEEPEYSTASWLFMLFAAGMGIGLVFWGAAEPLSFYLDPPVGEAQTSSAAMLSMEYTFMHWGIHPWACYAVVGLPLAYFAYRKGKPMLISSCLEPLVGKKHAEGHFGRVINIITLLVCVFGIATSLGMGASQINSGLFYVFGIPVNNQVFIIIVIVTMCCFVASSVSGIGRGIRILSDTNMGIAVVLLIFVFCAGPTVFLLNMFTESLGNYVQNIISLSFWADPFNDTQGWIGAWTIFYWGWWISWAPMSGAFIARVSRGRTIREYVLVALFVPALLCFVFMTVFGGSAIYLDSSGVGNIATALGENVSYTLFALLQNFPFTEFFSVLAIILICIFFVTSADSTTFVSSMMSCNGIQDPPALVKVFWGVIMASVAIVLQIAGGLSALQTACIAAAFPFMFVCIAMMVAFVKTLCKDQFVKRMNIVSGRRVACSPEEEWAALGMTSYIDDPRVYGGEADEGGEDGSAGQPELS